MTIDTSKNYCYELAKSGINHVTRGTIYFWCYE